MKFIASALGALSLLAAMAVPSGAHPHNHDAVPVIQPAKLVQLEAEEIMSFNANGGVYTVWNTHQRGLFGLELIEIHDASGFAVAGWWSSRGWCYTAQAYAANACGTEDRLARFAGNKLVTAAYDRPLAIRDGGSAVAEATSYCDHYTELEAKISGDTSGNCGYEID